MLPLVGRTTRALSAWLSPAYGGSLELRADLDQVEALAGEREALWARLEAASFLTQAEKRGRREARVEENGVVRGVP